MQASASSLHLTQMWQMQLLMAQSVMAAQREDTKSAGSEGSVWRLHPTLVSHQQYLILSIHSLLWLLANRVSKGLLCVHGITVVVNQGSGGVPAATFSH
jgi:hypothetical protein